ncbi:DUF1741-domain-containing protein [Nadsonia fulvescens var. elongata DSM 6958]|uniref:DUF1741-domain-containing protein n=1 Tax=Nadsonia fulvescens var. elongata DSM 6958 TaxID=857566 RepID=A0A1E3PD68_9ASCO|nr:DUF1741-domain-containing protein [Nadsonia fulvescens var. elongata DSM 6958]
MTDSPLVKVDRGVLQPKVISLYARLFKHELELSDEFWTQLFFLKYHKSEFTTAFTELTNEELIQSKDRTRQLFETGINNLKSNDLSLVENSLNVLAVLLEQVLSRNYGNQSADIISILAGFQSIDTLFFKLLDSLDQIIRNNLYGYTIRLAAIRTTIITACGSSRTSLSSYFTQRDIFASIMILIRDQDDCLLISEAFNLLGILASIDKMDAINPYQLRLADFIDDTVMTKIVLVLSNIMSSCRNDYQKIGKDEKFELKSLGPIFASWVGVFGGSKTTNVKEMCDDKTHGSNSVLPKREKTELSELPDVSIISLLSLYEFINVNKVFARKFVETTLSSPLCQNIPDSLKSNQESPFCSFISLCSYMFQNQSQSSRTALYSKLCLVILRIILEDQGAVTKALVSSEFKSNNIQICRQRSPAFPIEKTRVIRGRLLIEGCLDSLICCIQHNMKKALDVEMYILTLENLRRIIIYLNSSQIRLEYYWTELWKTMMSLVKFVESHLASISITSRSSKLAELISNVLALSLMYGDSILPDTRQYDDLFYKLIENGDTLFKFRQDYALSKTPSMAILAAGINHYQTVLDKNKALNGRSVTLSSEQVADIIKQGYNTLSLPSSVSDASKMEKFEPFKETEERLFFKKLIKQITKDTQDYYFS